MWVHGVLSSAQGEPQRCASRHALLLHSRAWCAQKKAQEL